MEVKGKAAKGGKRSRTSGSVRMVAVDRKEVEKERRQHMKQLCTKLASFVPKENYTSTDTTTQLGSLDEAAKYIKKLKERVEELRRRRSSAQAMAMAISKGTGGPSSPTTPTTSDGMGSSELEAEKGMLAPVMEVRQHDDSSIDVVLICCADRPINLHEVITILEEEGAEIVNANHSVASLKIFYTIHSRAFSSRIGIDVSRVSERLRGLVW